MAAWEWRPRYADGGSKLDVWVSWRDVQQILGHEHQGTEAEDRQVAEALVASGAPAWVRAANVWHDEEGMCFEGPD